MTNIDGSSIVVKDDLSTAGATINGMALQIADELHKLIGQLQPLMDTWTGSAATYYEGLQAEWNFAAEGLLGPNGVLGEIAQAMHVNWANYSEAEWANVQTWKHQ
ncbi:WXG100 family type VII secretion target [Streptomyces sp. DvalAA-14]|uniref:WXG100 family type VII secretion target n=1 Tax=unclassified Streptomyces TaxID=2593676 RepID=UPI00081BBB28|nr:WXG100 family type VII secretion target [Streptomyces sp. DvalAA-14]MYS19077.1 WXG100 family type VII secretion target [Streptomyces sp. SID4948]SCD36104.1 WXG100 family type VII secretion target [Streptomyces sp. DvalAA-14]